jgi:hypothetical protein
VLEVAQQIRVAIMEPNKEIEIKQVENTLETFQQIVGGYIEVVPFNPELGIVMVCNEEGKLLGLEPNFHWGLDTIVGTVVFVDGQTDEFRDLTVVQIDYIMNCFEN